MVEPSLQPKQTNKKPQAGLKELFLWCQDGLLIHITERCRSEFFTTSFSAVEICKSEVITEMILACEI